MEIRPDVAAAIRRSRSARAAERRRRRRLAAIAAGICIALSTATIVSLDALTGADMVHAAVAQAQDLAELIGKRSPGERTEAQLTKTKRAQPLARTLARTRPHPVTPGPSELAKILLAPSPEVPEDTSPPATFVSASVPLASAILLPNPGAGGGIVAPGGGSPPAGGSGVSPPGGAPQTFPPEPPGPVPSAVPEPQTWAMMLLGFGLIGWRARSAPAKPNLPLA